MKKRFLLLFAVVIFSTGGIYSQITKYRVIDENGVANMIFASVAISKGEEAKVEHKTTFTGSDAIYARCYLPKKYGLYNPRTDEQFVVDIYLDKKFVERKIYKAMDNEWDQIQLYIYNTGDDDFKNIETVLLNADKGEHTLRVSIGIERYLNTKDVLQDDGTIKKEKVFKVEYISEGKIVVTN